MIIKKIKIQMKNIFNNMLAFGALLSRYFSYNILKILKVIAVIF